MFWKSRLDSFVKRMRHHDIPVQLRLWDGRHFTLGHQPKVTLHIKSLRSLRLLLNPSLGNLGRAYVENEIDIEGSITDIIDVASQLSVHGFGGGKLLRRTQHPGRHTHRVDSDAIAYHYDVSNEFYEQFLDPNMVYSCAYFRQLDDDLTRAQEQKIDHILNKLQVQPGQTLLDIGCGWGALVMRAARNYGAKALGITLSQNQYELAQERIAQAGLGDRCEVRIEDYRDVKGRFDRVVSVGMFEHVGLKNLRLYFHRIHDLLSDQGVCLNHGITSTDPDSAESPLGGGDFIGRYVFPHGELPHIALALKEMSAAGLEAVDIENLRLHYAQTLRLWSSRFEQSAEKLRQIVGEKRFRIWRAYLAGCAHGFAQNWISLYQILAIKADEVRPRPLPLTRDYIYAPR
ncbi:MAG: Cyclopropane mycolic acid synthase 1 [Betaproteobacteria bacterium ADurb.Bin341]|nr:MAG: Cyclopropane mycolic acid synthase 1 [Betaproteobacteria bacterium ADurb.Bin341]